MRSKSGALGPASLNTIFSNTLRVHHSICDFAFRVCTSREELALIEDARRITGQAMQPLTAHLTSPYDSQWFRIFEQLDLDEIGLPICTGTLYN